jgi:hypothetical protein
MPFDPKILSDQDDQRVDGSQSELPAELLALGEQLRCDAAWLAERYPPKSFAGLVAVGSAEPDEIKSARPNPQRRWVVAWSAVAALVLVAFVGGVIVWQSLSNSEAVRTRTARAEDSSNNRADSGQREAAADNQANWRMTAGPSSVSLGEAEAFLMRVSGPELEAVLDLMEADEADHSNLSL